MKKKRTRAGAPRGAGGAQRTTPPAEKTPRAEDCRCKDIARKTPAELLRVALNDLAFWKKR